MSKEALISRRKNYLLRVLAVQEVYQANHREGLPDAYVYRKHIYPQFFICLRTFRDYLNVNAKRELRLIDEQAESISTP